MGKQAKNFDIKDFLVTELVSRKELNIEYCPTDEVITDYMKKPLVGGEFKLFYNLIMNISGKHHRVGQQECAGWNI